MQGFDGVRAYSLDPSASREFLEEGLAFKPDGRRGHELRGEERGSFYVYDETRERASGARGRSIVAWSSPPEEHEAWRERALAAGASPTPVIDRFYFRSVYFREPSGVLFELRDDRAGLHDGRAAGASGRAPVAATGVRAPREQVEPILTPLPSPRERVARWLGRAAGRAEAEHLDGVRGHLESVAPRGLRDPVAGAAAFELLDPVAALADHVVVMAGLAEPIAALPRSV